MNVAKELLKSFRLFPRKAGRRETSRIAGASSISSDDAGRRTEPAQNCGLGMARARVLRAFSLIALVLAMCGVILTVVTRFVHILWPHLQSWVFPSAAGLILIGASCVCLQFAVSRTRTQIALSLSVAVAFILWGCEQFLSNRAIVSLIDDVVVFLFVLDLSIVIHGQLRAPKRRSDAQPSFNPFGK
jgi:hypothetical protein